MGLTVAHVVRRAFAVSLSVTEERETDMNNADRLHAAEAEFDRLTEGGRDLITAATEPTFQFYDGEIVKGFGAAADRAEREVRDLTAKLNKAIDETNGKG